MQRTRSRQHPGARLPHGMASFIAPATKPYARCSRSALSPSSTSSSNRIRQRQLCLLQVGHLTKKSTTTIGGCLRERSSSVACHYLYLYQQ
jgi:hypothetical protein